MNGVSYEVSIRDYSLKDMRFSQMDYIKGAIILDWVILDGSESKNDSISNIKNILTRMIKQRGDSYCYFNLNDMNILPCRSCGACAYHTPGKCIVDDNMPDIIRAIASSSCIVLLTPIVFGGYSFQLKKAVDKFSLMAVPLFIVKEGHLLHPTRYGYKSIISIGTTEKNIKGETENFRLLLERNALNMQCPYHKALIFNKSEENQEIEYEILNMLKEVPKC